MLISGEVVGNGNQVSDDSVFMSNEECAGFRTGAR